MVEPSDVVPVVVPSFLDSGGGLSRYRNRVIRCSTVRCRPSKEDNPNDEHDQHPQNQDVQSGL